MAYYKGDILNGDIAGIQPERLFFRNAKMLDNTIDIHNKIINTAGRIRRIINAVNHNEMEVARYALLAKWSITARKVKFTVCYKVLNDLAQIYGHVGLHPETYTNIDAEKRIGNKWSESVFQYIRVVKMFKMEQPVMVCTFRLLVDNGLHHFALHELGTVRPTHIDQIGSIFRDGVIRFDIGNDIKVILDFIKFQTAATNAQRTIPNVHHEEEYSGQKNGVPSAMDKLKHVGGKESSFDSQKYQ